MRDLPIALFASVLAGLLGACGGGGGSDPPPPSTQFSNPELVTIINYDGHVMEPFISRDGSTLFFNDAGGTLDPMEKDLYYATFVDAITFDYQGPLNVNTAAVDGVPTMDDAGRFFFVSTANYDPAGGKYDTLYAGDWTGATVDNSVVIPDLAIAIPDFINYDLEVSPDGTTLYFNDGDFRSKNNFPDADAIVIAVDSGSGFVRLPNSNDILANVNTDDLEYAAAISRDGLELFFTRLKPGPPVEVGIYRATRSGPSNAFGVPERITAIEGFVEGPALSPDEKSLYYHRHNPTKNKFELYRVTRASK